MIFRATLTAGKGVVSGAATEYIHDAAAPYKFRIIDAWSVAASADGGTWKLSDGTNDITAAVTITSTDKSVNPAVTIDDAYCEIAATGTLAVVGDGTLADAEVYVLAMRVS